MVSLHQIKKLKNPESVGTSYKGMQKNGSEMTCIIVAVGDDLMWKGKNWYSMRLHFRGELKHLDRLITVFAMLKAWKNNFKLAFLKATTLYTDSLLCTLWQRELM